MAEMTAAEAIELLNKQDTLELSRSGTHDYYWGIGEPNAKKIAALLEQQAAEIAKKDRMIERATWVLDRTGSCPKTCDLMRNLCAARACWLAWLEKEETKEAEAQG